MTYLGEGMKHIDRLLNHILTATDYASSSSSSGKKLTAMKMEALLLTSQMAIVRSNFARADEVRYAIPFFSHL